MRTAAILLLMVGFLAAQESPGSVVVESQMVSILSLLGLSGLAILTAWLEREARASGSEDLADESASSPGS